MVRSLSQLVTQLQNTRIKRDKDYFDGLATSDTDLEVGAVGNNGTVKVKT